MPASAELIDDAIRHTRIAESLGFGRAWFAEHHFSNYSLCPSPLMMVAHAAAVTERIRLGTAVIVAPLHAPARLLGEIGLPTRSRAAGSTSGSATATSTSRAPRPSTAWSCGPNGWCRWWSGRWGCRLARSRAHRPDARRVVQQFPPMLRSMVLDLDIGVISVDRVSSRAIPQMFSGTSGNCCCAESLGSVGPTIAPRLWSAPRTGHAIHSGRGGSGRPGDKGGDDGDLR